MIDLKKEIQKIVLEILVLQPTLDTEKKYVDQLLQLHIQGEQEAYERGIKAQQKMDSGLNKALNKMGKQLRGVNKR